MRSDCYNFQNATDKLLSGSFDRSVDLTCEARAFKQIMCWVEGHELDLTNALTKIVPAPPGLRPQAGLQLREAAATLLSFLTFGVVRGVRGEGATSATRLVPVFYDFGLDCFFIKYHRYSIEESQPELRVHVETILDAGDTWSRSMASSSSVLVLNDPTDYLFKLGLLTWTKLLPDNSRASWEKYSLKAPIVPSFGTMLNRLSFLQMRR